MEAFNKIGGLIMEKYNKPCLAAQSSIRGIFPLVALSAAQLAGIASAAGLAVGMAASKGSHDIVSYRAGMVLQKA